MNRGPPSGAAQGLRGHPTFEGWKWRVGQEGKFWVQVTAGSGQNGARPGVQDNHCRVGPMAGIMVPRNPVG